MIIRALEPALIKDPLYPSAGHNNPFMTNPNAGDWTFGQGKSNYLSQNAAIGQNIQCRLLSFLGDCYFSLQDGIDWLNLFGSRGKKVAIELTANACILQSYGVTAVTQISSTVDSNRKISLSYSVDTIYTGVTSTQETVQGNTSYLLTQDGLVLSTQDGTGISI